MPSAGHWSSALFSTAATRCVASTSPQLFDEMFQSPSGLSTSLGEALTQSPTLVLLSDVSAHTPPPTSTIASTPTMTNFSQLLFLGDSSVSDSSGTGVTTAGGSTGS